MMNKRVYVNPNTTTAFILEKFGVIGFRSIDNQLTLFTTPVSPNASQWRKQVIISQPDVLEIIATSSHIKVIENHSNRQCEFFLSRIDHPTFSIDHIQCRQS